MQIACRVASIQLASRICRVRTVIFRVIKCNKPIDIQRRPHRWRGHTIRWGQVLARRRPPLWAVFIIRARRCHNARWLDREHIIKMFIGRPCSPHLCQCKVGYSVQHSDDKIMIKKKCKKSGKKVILIQKKKRIKCFRAKCALSNAYSHARN